MYKILCSAKLRNTQFQWEKRNEKKCLIICQHLNNQATLRLIRNRTMVQVILWVLLDIYFFFNIQMNYLIGIY